MQIALDAMGGDHAPGAEVAGALQAVAADLDLRVTLVGDRAKVEPLLGDDAKASERISILHCTQTIGMNESPVVALRQKPDNSISRCWQLLAEKKVDAVVSAGNTGAMVAGGFRLKLFLKGVRRPGIAAVMPTFKGASVVIDVGANVHPKPEHLYQYGVMGSIFAKRILNRPTPTIGLLNVGAEEQKGHDLAKDTHVLFNASALKSQFVGNIEGRDINKGVCDVIVTDGFVGNVVLKVSEGVFDFVMKMAGRELLGSLSAERDKAQRALQALVDRYDYHEHGGAPLLGIDGICIICHGSSSDKAIKNGLGVAARYANARLNACIVEELAQMPAD
jgi:glycerol-3-phosphate acyltransferase PlsX